MKASWEKIEKNQGVLHVEVDAEQVTAALDKAFKKVAAKVAVPGFRKGKVPRGIFESKYGVESLYQDAIDIILPEAYMKAVEETGIDPIDRPEIDVEQFAKGETFKFTAKVQVRPEVELGDYIGLEVQQATAQVTEQDLEEELKRMQQRHAELNVVEDGVVENGDIVIIDFEGFVNEEAFEGGKAEKYSLEIGSGSFIPGFEEQLIGMKKDEEKEVKVSFPETYHAENLAGQPAVFIVKLHDIKRKNLPVLDDEFAKDVSEFDTLDEYKQDIQKRLQEKKDQESKNQTEAAVVEKVVAGAEVEIPQVMIDSEVDNMLRDFEYRLRMQGMNMDLYYQFSGQNEAALREQMKGDAEKRVRNGLVLDAVAAKENLTVSEEELETELANMAKTYQKTPEELKQILIANGNLESIRHDLTTKKTIEFLVEKSKLVTEVA